jgi:hypothetical protein
MTIDKIISALQLNIFTGSEKLQQLIKGAYASDLLSDVMGRAKEGELWITMQTHQNIIAVASLKELAAVLIVNGGRPDAGTIATAESEGIMLLGTKDGAFATCGKLFIMMEQDAMVQG